jgi:hypothetical protein
MMSQSWQSDKACGATRSGPSARRTKAAGAFGARRHSRAGIDKDDNRFALDDRTEAHLPAGRSVGGSTLNA